MPLGQRMRRNDARGSAVCAGVGVLPVRGWWRRPSFQRTGLGRRPRRFLPGPGGGRSPDHHPARQPGTARCHAHPRQRARTSLAGV